jgi:hypothetical protein
LPLADAFGHPLGPVSIGATLVLVGGVGAVAWAAIAARRERGARCSGAGETLS